MLYLFLGLLAWDQFQEITSGLRIFIDALSTQLAPFALYAAFLRSDYYGASVPPPSCGHRAAIRNGLMVGEIPGFQTVPFPDLGRSFTPGEDHFRAH